MSVNDGSTHLVTFSKTWVNDNLEPPLTELIQGVIIRRLTADGLQQLNRILTGETQKSISGENRDEGRQDFMRETVVILRRPKHEVLRSE